ncbi:MAG: hypothetical protein DMF79_01520 [Acidobacteria bacterium]|nr:MAG: hypothetical protein DMF79_01520 [Acidobacteriota bacterium]
MCWKPRRGTTARRRRASTRPSAEGRSTRTRTSTWAASTRRTRARTSRPCARAWPPTRPCCTTSPTTRRPATRARPCCACSASSAVPWSIWPASRRATRSGPRPWPSAARITRGGASARRPTGRRSGCSGDRTSRKGTSSPSCPRWQPTAGRIWRYACWGRLYEGEKRLDEARAVLEEAARARPIAVEVLLDLARVAHKGRDYRGALGYLAHARDLKAGDARIHFFFGMVCVDLDLGVEAYNSLKEAVRLEPDNAAFNYALGATALHRRFPGEAIPYFRKYSELKPEDPRGSMGVGIAAYKSGDFATARAELAKAAAHGETAAGAYYFLARMARDENDLEEALRLARKAIEAKPDYSDPYVELGLLHLRKRELDKAEQALRRCLELDPDNYLGNFHLLMLYERTKDPRQDAQAQRFEEIKRRHEQKAEEFLRLIEVRPY